MSDVLVVIVAILAAGFIVLSFTTSQPEVDKTTWGGLWAAIAFVLLTVVFLIGLSVLDVMLR